MENYTALIVDMKGSKKFEPADREDIQYFIKHCISVLNRIFCKSLECEVIFSAGDEFQGLFATPASAYLYYRLLNMLIAPVKVRAGIGVGGLSVKIQGGLSTEQDGAAYHNARFAIESVNDKAGYDVLMYSENENDIFINSSINTSALLVNQQSAYQNELLLATELMYPIVMNEAMDLGSFPLLGETVAKKQHTGYYRTWKKGFRRREFRGEACFSGVIDVESVISSNEKLFYDIAGKIKGLSRKLASVTGTSRQSVEKSIKAGNIYQIRDINVVTLKMMHKLFFGDKV